MAEGRWTDARRKKRRMQQEMKMEFDRAFGYDVEDEDFEGKENYGKKKRK